MVNTSIQYRTQRLIDITKLIQQDVNELKFFAKEATGWVYNIVLSYVQNQEDAEEIVQDTLLAALKNIGDFNQRSALKTWICRIAINKSKDFLKYKKRQKRSGFVISIFKNQDDADHSDIQLTDFMHPGIQLEQEEDMRRLFEAINTLPEQQKDALILAKLEQMKMKEVAVQMNISVKAVESLLSRARRNLKKKLEQ